MKQRRIVLAADELSIEQLLALMKLLGSRLYAVKIHNLFDAYGNRVIDWLRNYDAKIWVDAKLHDIPNTVAHRAAAIKAAGADILTVHASGGIDMMKAAKDHGPNEVYGVTVLTSLDEIAVKAMYSASVSEVVNNLFDLVVMTGLNGVVCSPKEVATLYARAQRLAGCNDDPWTKFVVPGIRQVDAHMDDQARTATPGQAILNGASLLVVGRPITKAEDPLKAFEQIEREIEMALSEQRGAQ